MVGHDREDAVKIHEELLAITGEALLSNDFDSFAACFALPHHVETSDHKATIKTRSELRALFDRTVHDFERKRVTDLVRVCEVSEYRSPTQIGATHVSHLMCGVQRVAEPFPAFSIIDLIEGEWKLTSSQYALDKTLAVGAALNAHCASTSVN